MNWLLQFAAFVCGFVAISACNQIPKDPQRTEAVVRETGVLRLGWSEGAEADQAADEVIEKLIAHTGARVQRYEGESDQVLSDLAHGKLDIVYGHFARSSPWSAEVHFGSALGWRAQPPDHEPVPRFAMRNGENGWIMLVEAASRP